MPKRFAKLNPIEIAMVLAPFVMGAAVYTAPVQSDTEPGTIPMAFDSVGAMLRDIDREKTLEAMARGGNVHTVQHHDSDSCPDSEATAMALPDDVIEQIASIEAGVRAGSFQIREINSVSRMVRELEAERGRLVAKISQITERSLQNYDRWDEAQQRAEEARNELIALQSVAADIELQLENIDQPELAEAIRAALAAAEEALASSP